MQPVNYQQNDPWLSLVSSAYGDPVTYIGSSNNNQNIINNLTESIQPRGLEQLSPNWLFSATNNLGFGPNIHCGTQPRPMGSHNSSFQAQNAHVAENNSEALRANVDTSGANSQLKNGANKSSENNHESRRGRANFLVSDDDSKEAGSEHQFDLHEDKDVPENDDKILFGGKMMLTVPEVVVEVSTTISVDCWKGEIVKKLDAALDEIRSIKLPIANKLTIGSERTTPTVRNQTAPCIKAFCQVEAQNADSMQDIPAGTSSG